MKLIFCREEKKLQMQRLINYTSGRRSEVELQLLHLKVPPPPPLVYPTIVFAACESPSNRPFPRHGGSGTRGLARIMSRICIPEREKTGASPSPLMCRCIFFALQTECSGGGGAGVGVDSGPGRQPHFWIFHTKKRKKVAGNSDATETGVPRGASTLNF